MIYDNSTIDMTRLSQALEPYSIVISTNWIDAKKAKELDGVEDHIATVRYGLRYKFHFHTKQLPTLDSDDNKCWPYQAFLPIPSYLKQIKKTGRDIVALHFLNDSLQSITTLVTRDKILTRTQQIPRNQDIQALREILMPFVQKEGSGEFEVKIIDEKKLSLPPICSPFLPLDDYHSHCKTVQIFKVLPTLILIGVIVLAADSFRINEKNSKLEMELAALQQQKHQVERQIAAISPKVKNKTFSQYLEQEHKILDLLGKIPNSCYIINHDPKTAKLTFPYDCLYDLPESLKQHIEINPAKKELSFTLQ